MRKTEYSPIQIPKPVYEMLKKYCNLNALKMGKFVANLIIDNISIAKMPRENIKVVQTVSKYSVKNHRLINKSLDFPPNQQ